MKFLSLTFLLVTIAFAMAAPEQAVESAPNQAEVSALQSITEEASASTEKITTTVAEKTTTPGAEEVTSEFSPGNIKNIFKSLMHKTTKFFMENSQHFIH